MATSQQLQERELDELYDWIDSFTLSRPKKNISRDFSDGVLMAEMVSMCFPKLVELHNYPPNNSLKAKMNNWTTLNNKILSKLGISLALEDIRRLSNSTPMAIESLLYLLKQVVDEHNKQKEEDQRSYPNPYEYSGQKGATPRMAANSNKPMLVSKVEELREVLNLLKEKISMVEHSIDRKDAHIRQLEQTLKMYSN